MALLKVMLGHHIYNKNLFSAWQISRHDIQNGRTSCTHTRQAFKYKAKFISSQEMLGLEAVLYICEGAYVMLTIKLQSSVGLCNGTAIFRFINGHCQHEQSVPTLYSFVSLCVPHINFTTPKWWVNSHM